MIFQINSWRFPPPPHTGYLSFSSLLRYRCIWGELWIYMNLVWSDFSVNHIVYSLLLSIYLFIGGQLLYHAVLVFQCCDVNQLYGHIHPLPRGPPSHPCPISLGRHRGWTEFPVRHLRLPLASVLHTALLLHQSQSPSSSPFSPPAVSIYLFPTSVVCVFILSQQIDSTVPFS